MDAQMAVRIHTDNNPEMTHLSLWIRSDSNTNQASHRRGDEACSYSTYNCYCRCWQCHLLSYRFPVCLYPPASIRTSYFCPRLVL